MKWAKKTKWIYCIQIQHKLNTIRAFIHCSRSNLSHRLSEQQFNSTKATFFVHWSLPSVSSQAWQWLRQSLLHRVCLKFKLSIRNMEEICFKWLLTWHRCQYQISWSHYSRNCWCTLTFTHNSLQRLKKQVTVLCWLLYYVD